MAKFQSRSEGALRRRAERSLVARRVLLPAQDFIHRAGVSGALLVSAAVAALVWANSPASGSYQRILGLQVNLGFGSFVFNETLLHLINRGLMAIFFFAVGLEIKRELVHGNLSTRRRAMMPVAAALGGMVFPALIYAAFNAGHDTSNGWGIPMATDIAFALGALALLGKRIPSELRILLLALAVVDDIGSILVIALFYTSNIDYIALLVAVILVVLIFVMQRFGFEAVASYVLVGTLFWLVLLRSGIHATVAGVVLGFLTPARSRFNPEGFPAAVHELEQQYRAASLAGDESAAERVLGQFEDLSRATETPIERAERIVHPWVTFFILPLFALANCGVTLSGDLIRGSLQSRAALGIAIGLIFGKFMGIMAFSWLAVKFRIADLPGRITWSQLAGMSALGGIGFTVSLFIAGLAFADQRISDVAKASILGASVVAAIIGCIWLAVAARTPPPNRRGESGAEISANAGC